MLALCYHQEEDPNQPECKDQKAKGSQWLKVCLSNTNLGDNNRWPKWGIWGHLILSLLCWTGFYVFQQTSATNTLPEDTNPDKVSQCSSLMVKKTLGTLETLAVDSKITSSDAGQRCSILLLPLTVSHCSSVSLTWHKFHLFLWTEPIALKGLTVEKQKTRTLLPIIEPHQYLRLQRWMAGQKKLAWPHLLQMTGMTLFNCVWQLCLEFEMNV